MVEKNVTQPTSQSSDSKSELFGSFILLNAMLHSLSSLLSAETKLALSDLVANEHIRIHGSLTAKEVAHRVQMGSGATTALIDRLERKGYVRRTPHPTDRRSVVIESLAGETTSTPKLLEFLNRLQKRIEELDPALRPGMTEFMKNVSDDIMDVLKPS